MTDPPAERDVRLRRRLAWTAAAAGLVGLLGAVAVAAGTPAADRTFAGVADPTQSLVSVVVPFLAVLLVGALARPVRPPALLAAIGRALGLAAAAAAVGTVIAAVVTAMSATGPDRWTSVAAIAGGSLLVQGVAALVGTGLGLLVGRTVPAALATVVLPLGLWALLGAVPSLRPVQPWLTPYPSAVRLLDGAMTPTAWLQWLTVLLLWGAGLNLLGLARANRRAERSARSV